MMPSERPQVFVVTDAERGLRLDRFLGRRIPRMSRSSVQEAIAARVTLSSGAAPKPSRQVHAGEIVTIRPRPAPDLPGDRPAPAILLEQDGWMIVDKPAGLQSTPTASRPGDDLATLTGLHPAHRLDRFTSGCLLLTWTPEAARHFERAFREQEIRKEYLAIVQGEPARDAFSVEAALESDPLSRVPTRMRVAPASSAEARPALTDIVVLARGEATSLVRALPRTGRRHQVRAHLAHAGHPVVGDVLYGGDERDFVRLQLGQPIVTPAGLVPGRHLLHAHRLGVMSPGGAILQAEAPLPDDMLRHVPKSPATIRDGSRCDLPEPWLEGEPAGSPGLLGAAPVHHGLMAKAGRISREATVGTPPLPATPLRRACGHRHDP